MLAFNPSGSQQEGYLFWLSWLNHNFNSIFLTQDAEGPLRRGLIVITCNTARAAVPNFANELLKTNFADLPAPHRRRDLPTVT